MSHSTWRKNYDHLVSVIQETEPQSDPQTRFSNVRGEFTNGLADAVGRDVARLFVLRQVDPPRDDGSTGLQRRRMRVGMELDVLYPRGLHGEYLSGEDGPLLEARLRLVRWAPGTTIEHIPPSDVPGLEDVGADGQTGSVILRIPFDVIYMEDNTP